MTTTPTSGAAIQRYKIGYHADEWGQRSSTPSGIPDASGSWVRYADHVTALAAGQATAAQAVVQDDLITLRKPTTSAELLWLLKLAHLVISDVDKTLEETFAPAQPAAQQGAAYAALPTSSHAGSFLIGTCPLYTADQLHAFADATHTLRASHGQAPAQAGEYPAPDEIINMAREQGLPETEIEGVFRVNADDLCRVADAILAARKQGGA